MSTSGPFRLVSRFGVRTEDVVERSAELVEGLPHPVEHDVHRSLRGLPFVQWDRLLADPLEFARVLVREAAPFQLNKVERLSPPCVFTHQTSRVVCRVRAR